ncbi:MAG: Gfo/Idh/MocA family oxidoreductase [Planctomycetota bacterium]
MKGITRRDFVKGSMAAGAALAVPFSRVLGANDDIRVAIAGFRGKGAQHIQVFRNLPGVRVVALCDPDTQILNREVKKFTDTSEKVDACTDVRRLLDDKNIDAVVTASPNHWHALITVWACQAGKDVYVEKPVSHNIWEGRKMIEATRKYERIVQSGTQNRSDIGLREAVKYIQQGNLGKILWAHGLWFKMRPSIGRVDGPQPVPPHIDYDLWTGPAPLEPLRRKNLHYDWHWVWATGNGDMANLGAHQIDDCRWALGQSCLPARVISLGGRFGYIDDGETPNTQLAIFDYKPAPIILETRGLPMKKGVRAMDHYRGIRSGNIIQCEHGYFAGGRGGGWVFDNQGKKIKQFKGDGGAGHQSNFIKAMRTRKKSDLNADIREGHISAALCHMANISYRLGSQSSPDKVKRTIQGSREGLKTFERFVLHLSANEVDLNKTPVVLGPWLSIDAAKERFVGDFPTRWANELLKRDYRTPFVVPEHI